MAAALDQARRAAAQDEVPIGAVVMRGDEIVAEAHNETVARRNPTYHAEFLVIEGAFDEKAGMCGSVGDIVRHPRLNHRVDVQSGVEAEACAELIKGFFAARRG